MVHVWPNIVAFCELDPFVIVVVVVVVVYSSIIIHIQLKGFGIYIDAMWKRMWSQGLWILNVIQYAYQIKDGGYHHQMVIR